MTLRPIHTGPWAALPALAAVGVPSLVVLLDTAVVTAALPDIQGSLGAGLDEALWVLEAYLLAFAALLIMFGRLGAAIGRRAVFVGGLGVCTVAAVLCAAAGGGGELIAARVLHGAGAAALLPQALALISASLPAPRRAMAYGTFSVVAGGVSAGGLALGGLLLAGPGWPWVFYSEALVGVAGMAAAVLLVPSPPPARRHRLDLTGVLLAGPGLAGLVFGLVEGPRHGWHTVAMFAVPGVLATGAALLVMFVLWERRQPQPLLPLDLLRDRDFALAAAAALLTAFAMSGLVLVLVLQTRSALGMGPLVTGAAVGLPLLAGFAAAAPLAGRLADLAGARIGTRAGGRVVLAGGLLSWVAGVLVLAYLPTADSPAGTFAGPLLAVGAGAGLTTGLVSAAAMRNVAPRRATAACNALNTARLLGAVLGVASTGAVLQHWLMRALNQEAMHRVAQLPDESRAPFLTGFERAAAAGLQLDGTGLASPAAPPPGVSAGAADRFGQLVQDAFGAAFLSASRPALIVVAAAVLAAGALTAFLSAGRWWWRRVAVPPSIDRPRAAEHEYSRTY